MHLFELVLLEVKLLNYMAVLFLIFCVISMLFSRMVVVMIPSTVCEGTLSSQSSATLSGSILLSLWWVWGDIVLLICISLMISDVKHLFLVYVGHLSFGENTSIQVLLPFYPNQVICFLDTELYESFVYLDINLLLDISFAASVRPCFLDSFLHCIKNFLVLCSSICLFCLRKWSKNISKTSVKEHNECQCFLTVLRSPVLHLKSLSILHLFCMWCEKVVQIRSLEYSCTVFPVTSMENAFPCGDLASLAQVSWPYEYGFPSELSVHIPLSICCFCASTMLVLIPIAL